MTEIELVEATLAGDASAFNDLVRQYQVAVYNLAFRMLGRAADAEDIAQETFFRAYTKLETFDLELKFSTWLLSITAHLCIDHLRRKKAVWLEEGEYLSWMASSEEAPESATLRKEQEREVQRLMETLPAKYRLILVLRYWHDLSYAEIGEATHLAEGTVKTRLHRARQMLLKQAGTVPSLKPVLHPASA